MKKLSILSLLLPAVAACGTPANIEAETVAATGQALVDDGDTLEQADGDQIPDDEGVVDEAGESGDCEIGGLRKRVVERYDHNGDGALNDDERAALEADVEGRPALAQRIDRRRALHRAVLSRVRFVYDADDSRSLDDSERATLHDDLVVRCENRRARVLSRYDANGSGQLEEAERAQVRTDRRARMQARRAALLERFDADNDGALAPSERDAMRAAARERAADKRAALKATYDVDGDGALSADEKDALREHLRQRIRLETPADDESVDADDV